jgi:hypothetical protein
MEVNCRNLSSTSGIFTKHSVEQAVQKYCIFYRSRETIIVKNSLASAIRAHKLLAGLILGSLVASAGVTAAANEGTLGTLSFTVNSGFNITSIANLNLGTLNPGQTITMTSTATITISSPGGYKLFLQSSELLHEVFSSLSVTVTGLGGGFTTLDLTHESQTGTLTAGTYSVTVTVNAVVNTNLDHSVTATAIPFLGLVQLHPETHQTTTTTESTESQTESD